MTLLMKSGALSAALLAVMLCLAGTGYWSGQRLSTILAFITGPAWDTADGAMETQIGIQGEMNWMQSRLLGVLVTENTLADSTALANEAFSRLLAANIMDKKTSQNIQAQLSTFRSEATALRRQFDNLESIRGKFTKNSEQLAQLIQGIQAPSGKSLQGATDDVFNGDLKAALATEAFGAAFYRQLYELDQLGKTGDMQSLPQSLAHLLAQQERSLQALAASDYIKQLQSDGNFQFDQGIKQLFHAHKDFIQQLITLSVSYRKQFASCNAAMSELLNSLSEFEEIGDSAVEAQNQYVVDTIAAAKVATIIMLVIAVVAVVGNFLLLKIWVLLPMADLQERIYDLVRGKGDLTARIKYDRKDELGLLASSINQLMEMLHGLVTKINHRGQEIVGKIALNRSLASATFNHTKNVSGHAHNLASASSEVFGAASSIADACAKAAISVDAARNNTASCLHTTRATAKGMELICQQVNKLSERITQLRNSAETIGSIVNVIGGISDQTNLLALNAAIEAARAGEQGRGFAVVADEVRTLASRTSQSTQEITGVIQSIQDMSQSAFELINTCTQEVNEKFQDSQVVYDSLNALTSIVDDLSALVEQAASAAEQQTAVTQDMSKRVEVIAGEATEVDVQARDSMSSADDLNRLARELNQELSCFRV